MPYTAPTFAEAKAALASRLNDEGKVHWIDVELGVYIREAIRTWNGMSGHWRDQASFPTVLTEPFYDLPTELPTLRAYTVSSWELVRDLQYALMEPAAPGGTWTGTDQFTLAQLNDAISGRMNVFLRETGSVLTRTVTPYVAPPANGRLELAETVMDVRRAAWRVDATQLLLPLVRTDNWGATHYAPAWVDSTQPPDSYSVSLTPPLELQLIPKPQGDGTLDLVAIHSLPALDPLVDTLLEIPSDFAWVVKYGALAELLQNDGLARDDGRMQYCEQRWSMGIEQARSAAVLLNVEIDGAPTVQAGLSDADLYDALWQLVTGIPSTIMTAGQNLLIISPPPGGGSPFTISCDVVRNAPVPTLDADVLQVNQDLYDTILDLAEHLALFKEGAGQTAQAMVLLERVFEAAGLDLSQQQAEQPARTGAFGQTQQDRRTLPEQRKAIPVPVEG